jgi:hypothetical protein
MWDSRVIFPQYEASKYNNQADGSNQKIIDCNPTQFGNSRFSFAQPIKASAARAGANRLDAHEA